MNIDVATMIMKMKKMKKLTQIFCLVTCVLMMAAVAINRDHKIMGHEMAGYNASAEADSAADDSAAIMKTLDDGTVVVNTSTLGKDIKGYGGTTPLMISIRNGKIIDIKAMPNSESPEFFGEASSLFKTWIGKSVGEADSTEVDAVSGATYSSRAIIGNMRAGLKYVMKNNEKSSSATNGIGISLKMIIVMIVALMAAMLPLFIKDRRYHLVQLILNVIVLGFWSGTFISYSLLTSYLSNGMNVLTSLPAVILLVSVRFSAADSRQMRQAQDCHQPAGSQRSGVVSPHTVGSSHAAYVVWSVLSVDGLRTIHGFHPHVSIMDSDSHSRSVHHTVGFHSPSLLSICMSYGHITENK
jgi:uncharacterized protein with FMN-binding domain